MIHSYYQLNIRSLLFYLCKSLMYNNYIIVQYNIIITVSYMFGCGSNLSQLIVYTLHSSLRAITYTGISSQNGFSHAVPIQCIFKPTVATLAANIFHNLRSDGHFPTKIQGSIYLFKFKLQNFYFKLKGQVANFKLKYINFDLKFKIKDVQYRVIRLPNALIIFLCCYNESHSENMHFFISALM